MRIHRLILRNAAALLAGGLLVVAPVRADGPQAHGDRDEIRSQADLVLVQKAHGPERGYGKLLIEGREFGDFVFEADLRSLPGVSHCGLVFRYRDQRSFYRLVLRPTNEDFRVEKVIDGQSDYATTGHVPFPLKANRWYRVRLVGRGPNVEVWIDGERTFSRGGFDELTCGRAGVTNFDPVSAEFDSVQITDADGKKVLFQDDFDGGRLEGWTGVGPEGVLGQWGLEPKIERKELGEDFVEHYTYRAVTSLGRTHDLLDFPGIMKLRSGELLSIFIEELQHGTPPWATQPASGKLWMTRSGNSGRSWSPPTPFLDTPLDDRHCYTLQLSSGDLLSFWWVQSVAFGVPGVFNFASRSTDGGATWEDPLRVRSGKPARPDKLGVPGGFSLTVPPSELPDGALVMPIHCLSSVDRALPEIGLLRSRDGGRTWGDYSTIAYDPKDRISFVEPAVVRLRSGRWIAVTRTEVPIHPDRTHPYTLGPTMICTSTDEGRTWSEPDRLPLGFTWQGSTAPFLLQTDSGVVVFAVNTGIAFSYDGGKTWEPQAVNCGYYPNLLEIAPNTIAALAAGMQGRVFSLTKPTGGMPPPEGAATPPEVERDTPQHGQIDSSPWKPRGMFRAVRVRKARDRRLSPLLAQPNWPLLAVARTTTDDSEAIMGVIRSPEGKWSSPRLVAKASAIRGDPVLAQAADGTLLCAFPVALDGAATMSVTTSRDGGMQWSPPEEMRLAGDEPGGFLVTSPPVEDADGSWLVAGVGEPSHDEARPGVFRSIDGVTTWRRVADCPKPEAAERQLVEPSLAVTRDGRWVVLARQADGQGKGDELVVTASSDHGRSWSKPRVTRLKGARPEIVELFDSLFLAVAEDGDQHMSAAFAWDDLGHFQVRPLACGFCVRVGGRKYLARGAGVDLAGRFNNLQQVPLLPEEIDAALANATRRLPASGAGFEFKGQWQRPEEAGDGAFVSTDLRASLEAEFAGPLAVVVHDRTPKGRLVRVTIDGREYPPVDMGGEAESGVRTCIAVDLAPGPHKLQLQPLLAWRPGTMSVRALELSATGRE